MVEPFSRNSLSMGSLFFIHCISSFASSAAGWVDFCFTCSTSNITIDDDVGDDRDNHGEEVAYTNTTGSPHVCSWNIINPLDYVVRESNAVIRVSTFPRTKHKLNGTTMAPGEKAGTRQKINTMCTHTHTRAHTRPFLFMLPPAVVDGCYSRLLFFSFTTRADELTIAAAREINECDGNCCSIDVASYVCACYVRMCAYTHTNTGDNGMMLSARTVRHRKCTHH